MMIPDAGGMMANAMRGWRPNEANVIGTAHVINPFMNRVDQVIVVGLQVKIEMDVINDNQCATNGKTPKKERTGGAEIERKSLPGWIPMFPAKQDQAYLVARETPASSTGYRLGRGV